jgi:hypothetical protein
MSHHLLCRPLPLHLLELLAALVPDLQAVILLPLLPLPPWLQMPVCPAA